MSKPAIDFEFLNGKLLFRCLGEEPGIPEAVKLEANRFFK